MKERMSVRLAANCWSDGAPLSAFCERAYSVPGAAAHPSTSMRTSVYIARTRATRAVFHHCSG